MSERRRTQGPRYPGQGRAMQIEGGVAALIAAVLAGVAIAALGAESPLGLVMIGCGALVGMLGVARIYRGAIYKAMEDKVGPSLFDREID